MPNNKTLAIIVSVIVLAVVIAAFVTIGGPRTQRKAALDEQRVTNLRDIQYQIQNYYGKTGKLPQSLSNLKEGLSDAVVPKDPETNADYEYIVKSDLSFQLCAIFSLATDNTNKAIPLIYPPPENWDHAAGRVCFDRTANPQLDKPVPGQPVPMK